MRRLLIALVLALGSTLVVSSPAEAATVTRRDARGDADRVHYDMLSARYTNSAERFVVSARVRDLRAVDNRLVITTNTARMGRNHFRIVSTRLTGGRKSSRLFINQDQIPCRVRTQWLLRSDAVRVRLPMLCLGEGYGDQRVRLAFGNPTLRTPSDRMPRTRVSYD